MPHQLRTDEPSKPRANAPRPYVPTTMSSAVLDRSASVGTVAENINSLSIDIPDPSAISRAIFKASARILRPSFSCHSANPSSSGACATSKRWD